MCCYRPKTLGPNGVVQELAGVSFNTIATRTKSCSTALGTCPSAEPIQHMHLITQVHRILAHSSHFRHTALQNSKYRNRKLKLKQTLAYCGSTRSICTRTCREASRPLLEGLESTCHEKACLTPLGRQRHANLKSIVGPKIQLPQNLSVARGKGGRTCR